MSSPANEENIFENLTEILQEEFAPSMPLLTERIPSIVESIRNAFENSDMVEEEIIADPHQTFAASLLNLFKPDKHMLIGIKVFQKLLKFGKKETVVNQIRPMIAAAAAGMKSRPQRKSRRIRHRKQHNSRRRR